MLRVHHKLVNEDMLLTRVTRSELQIGIEAPGPLKMSKKSLHPNRVIVLVTFIVSAFVVGFFICGWCAAVSIGSANTESRQSSKLPAKTRRRVEEGLPLNGRKGRGVFRVGYVT